MPLSWKNFISSSSVRTPFYPPPIVKFCFELKDHLNLLIVLENELHTTEISGCTSIISWLSILIIIIINTITLDNSLACINAHFNLVICKVNLDWLM